MYRIIHLLPALDTGGTEKMVETITGHQVADHQVHVIVFRRPSGEIRLNENIKIHHCRDCYFQRRWLRSNISRMEEYDRLIRTIQPDYIHSHSYFTDIFMLHGYRGGATLLSHWHRRRTVLSPVLYGLQFRKYITEWLDKRWYQSLLHRHQVRILTVSEYAKKYHMGLMPEKLHPNIFLLRNAVPYREPPPVRRITGTDEIRLVSAGRLEKEKNHAFLIDVMRELPSSVNVRFKLDIFGDGSYKKYLAGKITRAGLEAYIDLKGNTDDLGNLMKRYHLYLHASREEQFGLSILEAFQAGLPVVALNYGAVAELVIDGETGFILNDEDPKAYLQAVVKLATDRDLYSRVSKNASEFTNQFDLKNYFIKLDQIYWD